MHTRFLYLRHPFLAFMAASSIAFASLGMAEEAPLLGVGQKAPDFSLPVTGSDENVTLSEELMRGPVVVVILRGYPGYQCPLCSRQVGELVQNAERLKRLGSKLILVYPGEPTLLEEHAAEFQNPALLPDSFVLVRDPGFEMVNRYGLRWEADGETAYPATFVIGKDQKIAWQMISKSHGGRAGVGKVLQALESL